MINTSFTSSSKDTEADDNAVMNENSDGETETICISTDTAGDGTENISDHFFSNNTTGNNATTHSMSTQSPVIGM
jgi:hypothetical protein